MDGKPFFHTEMGGANDHVAWTFCRLRYLSCLTKDQIKTDSLWEDFMQELRTAAYDAWRQNLNKQETWRFATRHIRAFLAAYGYKRYHGGYIRTEKAFSAVFEDWQAANLPAPEESWRKSLGKDTANSNRMEKRIIEVLKRQPEGTTRASLASLLEAPVKEIQLYLDQLAKGGKIIEVKREAWEGRITPLYLLVGCRVPEQRMVHTEMYDRIRQAIADGKSLRSITREYHHSFHTIYRALRMAPAPLAPTGR